MSLASKIAYGIGALALVAGEAPYFLAEHNFIEKSDFIETLHYLVCSSIFVASVVYSVRFMEKMHKQDLENAQRDYHSRSLEGSLESKYPDNDDTD